MQPSVESPGGRLLELFKQIRSHTEAFKSPCHLRKSEFFVLHALLYFYEKQSDDEPVSNTGITMSELGRMTRHTTPAVSQIIRVLEEQQLVERIPALTDRRNVYVRPTPAGKVLDEEVGRSFFALWDDAMKQMGEKDANQLLHLLDKLDRVLIHAREGANAPSPITDQNRKDGI